MPVSYKNSKLSQSPGNFTRLKENKSNSYEQQVVRMTRKKVMRTTYCLYDCKKKDVLHLADVGHLAFKCFKTNFLRWHTFLKSVLVPESLLDNLPENLQFRLFLDA